MTSHLNLSRRTLPSLGAAASIALVAALTASPAHAQSSTAVEQVDALEALAGKHPGARRSGAKGHFA